MDFPTALIAPRAYGRPGSLEEYLPSADEPIDRWFQAANASNVRTTMAIVADLYPGEPAYVVDPFAGSGSAAVVARQLRVPFYGIELDPVLACVTVAKALAREVHVRSGFRPAGNRNALASGCLGLVDEVARQTRDTDARPAFHEDLRAPGAPADERTSVVQGDATLAASWSHITPPPGHGVLYTSPPFGPSSPRVRVDASLRARAQNLLKEHRVQQTGATTAGSSFPGPDPYADLVVSMLRHAEGLGPLTAIIEHEPPDDGLDNRPLVADRISTDTAFELTAILETRTFSRRGPLTLLVCESPA